MKKIRLSLLTALALQAILSCNHPDIVQPTVPLDPQKTQVLKGIADMTSTLIATFQARSHNLLDSVQIFIGNPTDANLSQLQTTWRNTRIPWESNEAFSFGPIETQGIDPTEDTWPIDTNLSVIVPEVTQPGYLANATTDIKGFHMIELLLFGQNGTKKATGFSPGELVFLDSLAQELAYYADYLGSFWGPTGSFYINFTQAGTSASTYATQNDGLMDALNGGLIGLSTEMTQDKLGFPLNNIGYGESQFSDNSLYDYKHNLASILAAYTGQLQLNGNQYNAFSNLVVALNPELDDKIRTQIALIQAQMNALPLSFKSALISDRPQLQQIVDNFNALSNMFTNEVSPLLFSTVGQDTDPD